MKIIKIGEFLKGGGLANWEFEVDGAEDGARAVTAGGGAPYCVGFFGDVKSPDCPVTVNGVEIVEWTNKRREAMLGHKVV